MDWQPCLQFDRTSENTLYIASISYGKDSLAMLEVISDHNMPLLRAQHPLLWAKLLEWDQASPIPFRHGKRHGNHSVTDFDERFSFEDQGILAPNDHRFKWAKMEEYRQFHQLSIEEFQSHDK